METTGRDEEPEPLGVAPNVQERARGFEQELTTSPGEVVLLRILAEMDEWFRQVANRFARRMGLDPDDVCQEAAMRLLTSHNIDPEHEQVLGYVHKCIETAARDLAGRKRRTPEPARRDDIASAAWTGPGSATDTELEFTDELQFVDESWLHDVLDRAGLHPNHRGVLLRLVRDGDIPLAELAGQLRRSYAATRQDKHRATAALRSAFGLTTDELTVYSRWHHGLSTRQISREIGLSPTVVTGLLDAARHKIIHFLHPEWGADR